MSKTTPLIIVAHRCLGYGGKANSLIALQNALAAPVQEVEIDIRLTSDNKFVLLHSPFVKYIPFPTLVGSLTETQAIQQGLCTLTQALEVYSPHANSRRLRIEVKNPGAEQHLVDLLKHYQISQHIVVGSWHRSILESMHRIDSKIALSLSLFEGMSAKTKVPLDSLCVVPTISMLCARYIKSYTQTGVPTYVVDSRQNSDIRSWQAQGVVGLFLRYPTNSG